MVYLIPTRQDLAHYSLQVQLDDVPFFLSFDWNQYTQAWYFSIADLEETPLLSGRKILIDRPLLVQYRNPDLPPGDFIAVDTTSQHEEAKIDDLGTRVLLYYRDLDDFAPE